MDVKRKMPNHQKTKKELVLLEAIIQNPKINWSTPISHMVVRNPDFAAWGDSSLSQQEASHMTSNFGGIGNGQTQYKPEHYRLTN